MVPCVRAVSPGEQARSISSPFERNHSRLRGEFEISVNSAEAEKLAQCLLFLRQQRTSLTLFFLFLLALNP